MALKTQGVSLDVLEFNALSFADSSFGGIHNVVCKSGYLKIQWIVPW
jgi:hypothetical protein